MKRAPAIDTLRYAKRLAETGMNRETANVMAQALNEELEDRLLTKADLTQALVPIHTKLTEIDQRFEAVDAKVDSKVEALDAKVEALDAKVDAKFDALAAKVDAESDALAAKVDAESGALAAKFDSLFKCIVFGFSMVFLVLSSLIALGVIQFVRTTPPAAPVAAVVEQPSELPGGAGAGAAPEPGG